MCIRDSGKAPESAPTQGPAVSAVSWWWLWLLLALLALTGGVLAYRKKRR